MRTLATVFAVTACFAAAFALDAEAPALHKDIIDHVNKKFAAGQTTWNAGYNLKFAHAKLGEVTRLMGTKTEGSDVDAAMKRLGSAPTSVMANLPTNFDARSNWPKCSKVIGHIRDQADCGSCWAFGSTEALNDRMCIKSDGAFTTTLSAQDTTSCCNLFTGCFGSQGCNGGIPAEAWSYFEQTGVVTGGDYGSKEGCFPYELPQCNHHVAGPYPNCTSEGPTPGCPNPLACSNKNYATAWNNDLHHASSSYGFNSVEQIMSDLYQYGSVTAAFTVYQDFLTYKSGVYRHVTGPALGGHAIKIMGWGVENGTPYWLVANSWNEYWGDHGTFKILRGSNECGIESQVVAGQARIN